MIALLRGINVGARTKLAMADLRRVASEECGFSDVRTYIQSGNMVFTTTQRSADAVATTLAAALDSAPGISPAVVVRSRAQLDTIVEANPFLASGADPSHLHVAFLPAKAAINLDDPESFLPEEAIARGREVYLHLPGGVGRSKLTETLTKGARASARDGTMRNWRTVTTLAEMAADTA